MPDKEQFSDELSEFARSLGILKPVKSPIDRDVLFYEAGRFDAARDASARSVVAPKGASVSPWTRRLGPWIWPATSLVSTSVAVVLALMLVLRPSAPANPVDAPHDQVALQQSISEANTAQTQDSNETKDTSTLFDAYGDDRFVLIQSWLGISPSAHDSAPVQDAASAESEAPDQQTGTYLEELYQSLSQNSI